MMQRQAIDRAATVVLKLAFMIPVSRDGHDLDLQDRIVISRSDQIVCDILKLFHDSDMEWSLNWSGV